jgi:transposase InsO family protein
MNQGTPAYWVAQNRKGEKSAVPVSGIPSAAELAAENKQLRKFKATTNSNHSLPVADNLLNQVFKPCKPNEVWVSDITYISTEEGWLYLAGIKDVLPARNSWSAGLNVTARQLLRQRTDGKLLGQLEE